MIDLDKLISKAKSSLTHSSFKTETNTKSKDNSRYVFLGMFAFKGKVAQWLFDHHILGSGTELQQFYGNITGNSYMNTLFEKWNLEPKVRASNGFDIEKHKHIFVYGFLGFLLERLSKEDLDILILNEFFKPNQSKLPKAFRPGQDKWSMLSYFCKLKYNKAPKISTNDDTDNITHAKVIFPDHTIIATSKSYKYARKKAIHQALQYLLLENQKKLMDDPFYIAMRKEKEFQKEIIEQENRLQRIQIWQEKQENKKVEKERKNKEKQAQAKIKDLKRKTNKALLKKSAKQSKKDFSSEDIKQMSSAKRRILEDRGIIQKRK